MPAKRQQADLVAGITDELQLIRPDTERIAADCTRLRPLLGCPPGAAGLRSLRRLASAVVTADAEPAAAAPILALVSEFLPHLARPWSLLTPLLQAADDRLAAAAFGVVRAAVEAGVLAVDRRLLLALAARIAPVPAAPEPETVGADPFLAAAAGLLGAGAGVRHRLERILTRDRDPRIRFLAARLLDLDGGPADARLAREMLGEADYETLGPYLEYTRANCSDLLALVGGGRLDPAVVPSLRQAAARWGAPLVRRLVAELGWEKLNRGVDVLHRVEVTVPGHVPAMVAPEHAELLVRAGGAQQGPERLVLVARGAATVPTERASRARCPVDRFRVLNTTHAELLAEILDVAPLDAAKVQRILDAMDRIVADYVALFADASDECVILPAVYGELRRRVVAALAAWRPGRPLPVEATRLVQTFEDPPNLGAVRTIHGLKRYLHQQGLKLGFALVDTAQAPNRSVDLVLANRRGRLQRTTTIRYAEFEQAAELEGDGVPYPVRLVVDSWIRALLYGRTSFPDVNIFLFGNEVQYYVFFRNHPVFLRIDFSPPQRGGMIDLEYYGVSGYELDVHPNIGLDAVRRFFGDLDFEVGLEGVRLQARYDKERCPDLRDLCAKAAALLRLTPWLMELDWLIGSLALGPEGRRLLIESWSRRFRESGVLPERALLTSDRRGILRAVEPGPTGPVESRWDGAAPYTDRFCGRAPPGFAAALRTELEQLGLPAPPVRLAEAESGLALLVLEEEYLAPLAAAVRQGLVVAAEDGLRPADPHLVQRRHEAECFAAVLAGSGKAAAGAVAVARPLAVLERFVDFAATGWVGRLAVARAAVPVRGGTLSVFVLRDGHGLVRMGLVSESGGLLRRRSRRGAAWRCQPGAGAERLWALLRGANYVAGAERPAEGEPRLVVADLRRLAADAPARGVGAAGLQAKVLCGLKAAPGRAVGRAVFGTGGRRPADLAGAVLVAREVKPGDAGFLRVCAGVVSTGGAVLSHAALLAMQFGKPALLAAAQLEAEAGRKPALRFTTVVHRDREQRLHGCVVSVREVSAKRDDELCEGDLVVLDADEGVVRVLGQDRDALGLHEGLRLLGEAAAQAAAATRDGEVLAARALHLRARHQLEKILDRLTNETLAGFAVEEIVAGASLAAVGAEPRATLLARLAANTHVAAAVRTSLGEVADRLAARAAVAHREARETIPRARLVAEIVGLRLRARRSHDLQAACVALLGECGLDTRGLPPPADLDGLARRRLTRLAGAGRRELERTAEAETLPARARHLLREVERCASLLTPGDAAPARLAGVGRRLAAADRAQIRRHREALILPSGACGFALQPLVGWKAANLGEMDQLAGPDLCPAWFAVTDRAFNLVIAQPGPRGTLRDAVAEVLAQPGLDATGRSAQIQALWREASLPADLADTVATAYAALADADGSPARVAIRSSSCDEDTEAAMRAGEFETYLNVSGEGALMAYLRLTWAGLWSEQALHSRAVDPGVPAWPRGGLIVQRMVDARVSGVVQTVNVARGDLGEMVVNAGLGLGEGVVSGMAAADLVTVVKPRPGDAGPLQFNYLTADKPLQVVRDERRGTGTRVVETLYHQRLRPALEYVELCELVEKCLALEQAYGYPLDLEFAVAGHRLWLLQARPIGTFLGELQETLARHSLAAGPVGGRHPRQGARS